MSSSNDQKNMLSPEEAIKVHDILCSYFRKMITATNINDKLDIIHSLYQHMNSIPSWTSCDSFASLKPTVVYKSYEFIYGINSSKVISETKRKNIIECIDETLRNIQCNHKVGNRYCRKKKVGKLCTFHNNRRNKIINSISSICYSKLNKDVLDIVFSYI